MPPVVDVSAMTLTPDSEGANNTKLKIVEEFLRENPSIQYIRFQWLDYTGVATCRVVTKSYCLKLAKENGSLHLPSPMLTTISLDTSIAFEDIEAGEDQIWPDWSTLVPCYYQSGHAQVMCFVEEGGATGSGFLRCPRYRLKDLVSKAKAAYNLEFLVGLEIEFYILPSKDGTNPIEMVHNAFSTASLRNPCLPIVEEIVSSVSKAGFEVRQFHSEGAPGLFEFSLEPLRPLRAADALVYSHEAIKSICVKHGLYGTVHPKPFEKLSSAGSHIHLSISQVDKADKFLAGLLDSFCALAAFYMPNFDSHTRLRPGSWVYWGTQNKAAPIKKVADGYWELRTPDGTMNPYLTLLAILTAGILGIKNEMELTVKDSNKFAMTIDEKEVEEKCIKHKLPTSLMGAITSLKEHTKLREALGEEIVEKYLKIKTKEADIFEKLTWSERREITTRIF